MVNIISNVVNHVCGNCGAPDVEEIGRDFCAFCGADYWIALEDFDDPELHDYVYKCPYTIKGGAIEWIKAQLKHCKVLEIEKGFVVFDLEAGHGFSLVLPNENEWKRLVEKNQKMKGKSLKKGLKTYKVTRTWKVRARSTVDAVDRSKFLPHDKVDSRLLKSRGRT